MDEMDNVVNFGPRWRCQDCGKNGSAEQSIPIRCPRCGKTKIKLITPHAPKAPPNG